MYGDCPYFEAGKGFITGNVKPAYDKQELIYKDFLKELGEAADALTASGDKVTGDIIFQGNIDKWKRFANSLHLRYAMRIVNADPELAKAEAIKAVGQEAGLMQSAADDALIAYTDIQDWASNEFRRNGLAQYGEVAKHILRLISAAHSGNSWTLLPTRGSLYSDVVMTKVRQTIHSDVWI